MKFTAGTLSRRTREEQETAVYYRWRALRLLSSLGHVDVKFEAQEHQRLP